MEKFNIRRVVIASAVAVPSCAATAALLFFLPSAFALGGLLVGLALLKIGHGLHYKWLMVGGGVLMFGSLLAWAVRA